ncbi:MAG: RDD family protein [Saprospiraceae bacterium]|nr:RDD family protein [Pyrinomonadaceae bacterium]
MMCPVCKRDLAPSLSICTSCGAMMNDTVREELQTKPVYDPIPPPANDFLNLAIQANNPPPAAPAQTQPPMARQNVSMPPKAPAAPAKAAPASAPVKFDTSDLAIKKTSPTLVAFETKNAQMPDWRLQLQNSVRQRNNGTQNETASVDATGAVYKKQLVTNGANALKTEYVEDSQPAAHANSKVAAALKRIEDSRRAFLPEDKKAVETALVGKMAAKSNYPFNVVSRSAPGANRPDGKPSAYGSAKPKLVSSLRIEKKAFDTNKLPPLPKGAGATAGFDQLSGEPNGRLRDEELLRIPVNEKALAAEIVEIDEVEADEIDDLAPLAMRFNAGLFDLIIGGFASFILLSPFLMTGGTWLSLSGFFAFAAALAIVMFVYLTASIGYSGRTFGMRVFSLELVDAEQNEYPTLHQAAVSSAVYLLSLALAGIGLLPIFFNDERRAAHDLVSGTILIREY